MQIVHGYRKGKNTRQLVISTLGRYDEKNYRYIQEIVRDMQRLDRFQEVINEINNHAILPNTRPCSNFRCGKKGC